MSKTSGSDSTIGCGCFVILVVLVFFLAYAGLKLGSAILGPLAGL